MIYHLLAPVILMSAKVLQASLAGWANSSFRVDMFNTTPESFAKIVLCDLNQ